MVRDSAWRAGQGWSILARHAAGANGPSSIGFRATTMPAEAEWIPSAEAGDHMVAYREADSVMAQTRHGARDQNAGSSHW
jgi:hypothetical protein